MSIQALLQAKLNSTENARKLGFSRSTIRQEFNRGKVKPTALANNYRPVSSRRATSNVAMACLRKLGSDKQTLLWRTVIDGLHCRWSPQQISVKPPFQHEFFCLYRVDGSRRASR